MNKYSFTALIFTFLSFTLQAQAAGGYDQLLQQSNKMIAVILVLVIILFGIAGFLVFLERRIKDLEKRIKQK
jgi:CcmD family protein